MRVSSSFNQQTMSTTWHTQLHNRDDFFESVKDVQIINLIEQFVIREMKNTNLLDKPTKIITVRMNEYYIL